MKIIAHRANIRGTNIKNENKISSIKKCIELGYDVEIDIRFFNGYLYLGHDQPKDIITKEELLDIKTKVWIHCKNLKAISYFKKIDEEFNYFWHEKDSYTLTSRGYVWSYPGQKLSKECICVLPEIDDSLKDIKSLTKKSIAGICTDYPNLFN